MRFFRSLEQKNGRSVRKLRKENHTEAEVEERKIGKVVVPKRHPATPGNEVPTATA